MRNFICYILAHITINKHFSAKTQYAALRLQTRLQK